MPNVPEIVFKGFPGRIRIGILLLLGIFPATLFAQNLLSGPNDIVFDKLHDRYLVSNWAGNTIVAIDSDGRQKIYKNNVNHAHGMEIRDSVLYVASFHHLMLVDLSSSETIDSIYVRYSQYLGHIALDSAHFVYITDWSAKRLFRVNINNKTSASLHSFNTIPGGISFDENNNRLIILTLADNAPILAYDFSNGNLSTILNTDINEPDAICQDAEGNFYITSFSDDMVFRFDKDFSTGPHIVSTNHNGPSGIGYNSRDHIIGVTNYRTNRIDLIVLEPTFADFEREELPGGYILDQNYPNPFYSSTRISYSIPKPDFVTLMIYDMHGREIQTLVNKHQPANTYYINFRRLDLPFGNYLYRLQVGNNFSQTKKMLYLK